MKHLSLARSLVMVGSAASLAGCYTNQGGNVSSSKMGDISNPATTGSPVDELREACGGSDAMTAAGEAVIRRKPYLQRVTQTSITVGWVSAATDGEHVVVTTPNQLPAASVPGERESVIVRNSGESQKWATIDNLQPGSIYCYAIVDGTTALSERIGFRTAPAADSPAPVRFLAFGDSGGGGVDQRMLAEQMYGYSYDLIVHTGDIAYDSGTIGEFEDTVFKMYSPLFRHVPFFPASGNHEYKTMQGAPFRAVFSLPGASGERWYSYDWGRVHFAALDTEADYQTQAKWLDADLAATARPWKIVYFHKPPYSSGEHGSDTSLRKALEPIFQKHHVQLVLAGHDHNYERMTPQKGVQHIVTGGGGVGTRPVGVSSFTAFSEDVIHFVYVDVRTDEAIVHAVDANGLEFDSVVVPR
ncbi:MAG TPA: metallophosphoesterase family protein [Kofleriaceae bacterium]|nr:metallophosphoesterase family protein [Kofleriaceae bacterium]